MPKCSPGNALRGRAGIGGRRAVIPRAAGGSPDRQSRGRGRRTAPRARGRRSLSDPLPRQRFEKRRAMAAYQYIYVMRNLSKIYPGGREIMKNITLAFLPGAKIGVLGVNGAGKSTLLRIMAGLDQDFGGEAWAAEGVKVGF